jgi:archaellum biogenesis ATPase FlaH
MPKTPSELAEELSELPASAIAMSIRDETYFDAVRGIVDMFATKKDLNVVYISATIPSNSIIDVLKILEIDMSHINFVDCVSQSMMSSTKRNENVHQVESPTMLENIMLKVEYLMKKNVKNNSVVLLDSINALAIHNSAKILSEFVHILINNLRAKNAYIIIFSHEGYSSEEISNMMSFVCDLNLSMKKEGEK